ncbi:hypothetical protein QQX98_007057 [Neonectria punicea]|uniref:Amine oxidase n=1 Tax=Neonectria punicea TaxID=979145 RepID=A0ABR1GYV4_9HYPO
MAPYHQHLFNVRIDPAIDGHSNSFVYSDSVQMPWDNRLNPLGTGYVTKESTVNRAGPVEDSLKDGRVFKIVNQNVENPVSHTPTGYKLVPIRSQMLLAQPGSWHWRRSDRDYTNQSPGGHGIKSWVKGRDYVVDDDIVIWHSFGFTHNPRVEDFPIMPAEIAQFHLKPYNFCQYNPANDVPPSSQAFNKSILYEDAEPNGTKELSETGSEVNGKVKDKPNGTDEGACCKKSYIARWLIPIGIASKSRITSTVL